MTLPKKIAAGLATAVAVPALMLGFGGVASAAEIGPIGDYLDDTVAGLSADLVAIVTALLT